MVVKRIYNYVVIILYKLLKEYNNSNKILISIIKMNNNIISL